MLPRQSTLLLCLPFALSACGRGPGRADLEALVRGAVALEAPPPPRPLGRPTLGGTSGEALLGRTGDLAALAEAKELSERCTKAFEGDDAAAHKACTAELASTRPAWTSVTRAADAEFGVAPAPMHPLAPQEKSSNLPRQLLAFCTRSKTEATAALRGDAREAALTACARTIEIAVDFSRGGSMVAGMAAASCISAVAPVCGRAAEAAGASPAASAFAADLKRVEDTMPRFSALANAELFSVQLSVCGSFLSAEERDKLGPRGKWTVAEALRNQPPAMEAGVHAKLCKSGLRAALVRQKVYELPKDSPAREAARREGAADLEADTLSVDLGKYEERWDAARSAIATIRGAVRK